MRSVGIEANGLIHCYPEGLFGLFDSTCFASYCKVFVVVVVISPHQSPSREEKKRSIGRFGCRQCR